MAEGPADPTSAPTPAATVVPLRDGVAGLEVLLLHRSSRGAFGGAWVFPGGQIDPDDWSGGGSGSASGELAAARRAAVREAREEAALDLDADDLVHLSFWLPPPETPRRFATWFFVARVTDLATVVVDRDEIHDHRWTSPEGAIAACNAGEIELVPPTFMTLWWLTHHDDVDAALGAARARTPEHFESRMAAGADRGAAAGRKVVAVLWAGDAGYADADIARPGPRRRLWMRPGDWQVEITP